MKMSYYTACFFLLILIGSTRPAHAQSQTSPASGAEVREKVASNIADNLAKNDFTAARKDFAKIMLDALSENKLKEDWNKVLKQMGDFKKVLTTSYEEKSGYKIISKRCQFANENASIRVTFNEENQVIGLYFKP